MRSVTSAEGLAVDTSRLSDDANTLKENLQQIKSNVDDMYNAVNTLNSMWKGTANRAFNSQFKSDYEQIKEFLNSVEKFSENIGTDAEKYESCEQSVMEMVSNLNV